MASKSHFHRTKPLEGVAKRISCPANASPPSLCAFSERKAQERTVLKEKDA
jgi:hypothetical protein